MSGLPTDCPYGRIPQRCSIRLGRHQQSLPRMVLISSRFGKQSYPRLSTRFFHQVITDLILSLPKLCCTRLFSQRERFARWIASREHYCGAKKPRNWAARRFTSQTIHCSRKQPRPAEFSSCTPSAPRSTYTFKLIRSQHLLYRGRPPGSERKSLSKDCGWKDGDRGGSVNKVRIHREEHQNRLDSDRPSHGRS
jgi:hypothetical protein